MKNLSRPPVAVVIYQHAEDAASLWEMRELAVAASNQDLNSLCEYDQLLAAHLEGLSIGGDFAREVCEKNLTVGDSGEMFVAAFLYLQANDKVGFDHYISICNHEPRFCSAVASAIACVKKDDTTNWLRRLLNNELECSIPDFPNSNASKIVADIVSISREFTTATLQTLARSTVPEVRARTIQVIGELRAKDLLPVVQDALTEDGSAGADETFWAYWAAVLLGDVDALAGLSRHTELGSPYAESALQLCVRVMNNDQVDELIAAAFANPQLHRAAIIATGLHGDPVRIPKIIECMRNEKLARVAGEALSTITNIDIANADLECEETPSNSAGPTDDPDCDRVALDQDEDLPWPDHNKVVSWWATHSCQFDPGVRYLCGLEISASHCFDVLKHGRQRQRVAAAYELAMCNPNEAIFPWWAPGLVQKVLLQAKFQSPP